MLEGIAGAHEGGENDHLEGSPIRILLANNVSKQKNTLSTIVRNAKNMHRYREEHPHH